MAGKMSAGEVVAAINYLSFALFPILLLTGMLGPISAADASASRILEVLDADPQVRQTRSAPKLVTPRGRIVFEGVYFSYSGNSAEPVLSDVSFTAEPGETVAIVGATGSGKSTLIHLIPRCKTSLSMPIPESGSRLSDIPAQGKQPWSTCFPASMILKKGRSGSMASTSARCRGTVSGVSSGWSFSSRFFSASR